MKNLFTKIWNFLKKIIKIKISVNIYIFVNNQWIEVEHWQFKKYIEDAKSGKDTGIQKVKFLKKNENPTFSKAEEIPFTEIVEKGKFV